MMITGFTKVFELEMPIGSDLRLIPILDNKHNKFQHYRLWSEQETYWFRTLQCQYLAEAAYPIWRQLHLLYRNFCELLNLSLNPPMLRTINANDHIIIEEKLSYLAQFKPLAQTNIRKLYTGILLIMEIKNKFAGSPERIRGEYCTIQ